MTEDNNMNFGPEMKIRYILEQELLPQMLFSENGSNMINTILREKGGFFTTCLQFLAEEEKTESRYKDTDFTIQPVPFFDDDKNLVFSVIIVDMPKPKHAPLCSRIFICHDGQFKNAYYFLVEKSFGSSMLCGRDRDGNHLNYGPAPKDIKDQFQRVVQLCKNRSENEKE